MRKYLGLTALLLLTAGLTRADTKIRPTNLNTDPGLTWRLGGVIVGPHGAMSVDSGQTPGSVTSVNAVSGIPGLSLAGGPITGAGTFTLGLTDAAALRAAIGVPGITDFPSKTGVGATGDWNIGADHLASQGETFGFDGVKWVATSGMSVSGPMGATSYTGNG
jgi:hypothetical protein